MNKPVQKLLLSLVSTLIIAPVPLQAQLNCPAAWTSEGVILGENFGYDVRYAGDQNSDGYGDIIVGTAYTGAGELGKAYVISGMNGSVLHEHAAVINYGSAVDRFGWKVAGGMNIDNYPGIEYCVGALDGGGCDVGLGDAGVVMMYAAGNSIGSCLNGSFNNQDMSSDIDLIPDVNGDGYAEVIAGAFRDPGTGVQRGRIFVYAPILDFSTFGQPLEGVIRDYSGLKDDGILGYSVSRLGDVNGDSIPDVIGGAPTAWWLGPDTGYVYVFSGASSNTILWHQKSPDVQTRFGWDVRNAGDLNGDGFEDVVVGEAYSNAGGTESGRIWAYSGTNGNYLWDVIGPDSFMLLGHSVTGLGDVNGDSIPDVAAGAPKWNANRGRVYVYSGSDGSELYNLTGPTSVEWFGTAVASGKINDDDYEDLIVSSMHYSAIANSAGRVYVYYNGDPDGDGSSIGCDNCPNVGNPGNAPVVTGDVIADGSLTSADIIGMVNFVFKGAAEPEPCAAIADVNCDGVVTSADIIHMVNHVFKGGDPPCDICTEGVATENCI